VSSATVEFCGELWAVDEAVGLSIGRDADLVVDDNPRLHRRFLRVYFSDGLWWLANTGRTLTATLADPRGTLQSWLPPGARMPLTLPEVTVRFSAGPTAYELTIAVPASFTEAVGPGAALEGSATHELVKLSPKQKLMILALAEHVLDPAQRGRATLPTSKAAAARLGWGLKAFESMLDHVCGKLAVDGVPGMHSGRGGAATQRRARLVEYALAVNLVSAEDLAMLPHQ
jgi:hypothetical protein